MAKGSQLNQLKSALNQAGLVQQPKNGKKRKRSGSGSVLDDKEKERRAARLREIQQKMNPFDVKITKVKHDVGGRKIAGTVGRPAQSKQAGIEQRKKTLLKEYEDKNRAGGIVDRRFGENDSTLTPEERMLERFTRERKRASKSAMFNLEDEEELTHYGQSLSKLDDFDNVGLGLGDEDEDGGQIDKNTVQKSHFGGFGDESEDEGSQPDQKKTKAEVMAEVIAKSKEHKHLRQLQQEQDEELRLELDHQLDSIRSLLFAPEAPSSTDDPTLIVESAVAQPDKKDQEYDQLVRELVFERRAKPKDRTKTEEEIALEEKEALEKAERKRIRRMNGEDWDSNEEDEGGKRGARRQRGGGDLDDDFLENEPYLAGLGGGLGEVDYDEESSKEGREDSEGEDGDEIEGGEDEESEDEDGNDEGEDEDVDGYGEGVTVSDEDEENDDLEEQEVLVQSTRKAPSKKQIPLVSQELPFTFPCPTTHDEFLEIVENVSDDDVPTVIKRIRTLHHPSLAEDNKIKLQALTGVLIDHILHVTALPTPHYRVLPSLVSHLYSLSKSYPIQSAEHFVSKMNLMQRNLNRGIAHGVTQGDSRTWPGMPELSFLRVVGIIWPTSDLNHPVVNPARLLIGSYLGLCRVRSLQDVASGLFLCTLCLQFEELSKRLVPEAINFLENTLLHIAPHHFKNISSLPGGFPSPDFRSERLASLSLNVKKAKKLSPSKPELPKFFEEETVFDEQCKVDLLHLVLELVGKFADLYKGLDGFIELYRPISDILDGISEKGLPNGIQSKLNGVKDALGRLLKFAAQGRRPLKLQDHKPIPIPTYVPKFEQTSSNYLRNRDPDHERNEAAKLRAEYKQERKGAIRELRKDAHFLAAEQQKKQRRKDKEYHDRMNKVVSSLEGERAEQKALERGKAKEKRRAGRK